VRQPPTCFRSLFISDVHLGNPGCQAEFLLEFLRRMNAETIYLVGDIVDAESLGRRFYWPKAHNDILRALLDHARRGTRVIYVPGNHDVQARAYCGLAFGPIEIRRQAIHETVQGKRYLVMHGDELDRHLDRRAWVHLIGALTYRQLVRLNSSVNGWRRRAGLDYWPVAAVLKRRSSAAQIYIERFRSAAVRRVLRLGLDGCILGHIHRPEIMSRDHIDYLNCGDWVEHCTAIAEDPQGRMHLIDWPALAGAAVAPAWLTRAA
jgi:UDP-2,3-diacylglucosamine pyrophosphatase LpxH